MRQPGPSHLFGNVEKLFRINHCSQILTLNRTVKCQLFLRYLDSSSIESYYVDQKVGR